MNFSSAGSSDPKNSPLTYLWDFGHGQTSTAANPFHNYASAPVQTFTVTLTVTNNTSQRALRLSKSRSEACLPRPPSSPPSMGPPSHLGRPSPIKDPQSTLRRRHFFGWPQLDHTLAP